MSLSSPDWTDPIEMPLVEALEPRLLLSVTLPAPLWVEAPSDNPTLPLEMDVYAAPVSAQTPTEDAPALAELIRTAQPDDVIALTGYQLSALTGDDFGSDAQFVFYGQTTAANGTLADGSILVLESDQASIVVPATQLDDSMYLLWAVTDAGASYPLAVNRTEAWWTGCDTASVGQTVSVYGRNLSYYDSTYTGTNESWIYLRPTSGGAGQWVDPTAVNPYKVDFTVPSGLANGTYEVWVHNGHGGEYGWSRSGNLTVQAAVTFTGTVRNVQSYGAVGDGVHDDTSAVTAAIAAAGAGGQVYFPTGTYLTTGSFTIPSNVRVYGDGAGSSLLKGTKLTLSGTNQLDHLGMELTQGVALGGNWNWISNVTIHETGGYNYSVIAASSKRYLFLTDSKLIGNHISFLGGQSFIDGCVFEARFDAEDMIESWGGGNFSITNNTFRHYDTSNPYSSSGWGEGRAWVGYCIWGKQYNQYFGDNTMEDFVVRAGGDQNSGEQFLWEGSSAYWEGSALSGTANTVTLDVDTLSPGWNQTIIIVAGKGMGQTRDFSSWDAETRTLTVGEDWNVIPDATSVIQLVQQPERIVMYNNHQEGTATAVASSAHVANMGTQIYNGANDLVYDHNMLIDMRYGVNLDTSIAGTRVYWVLVSNNSATNVRWGGRTLTGGGDAYGPTVLGVVWRSNTINTVNDAGAAFNEYGVAGSGAAASPVLEVYDKNTVSNASTAYYLQQGTDPHNTVFYGNSFSRGTGAYAGSTGLEFGTVSTALAGRGLYGEDWSDVWAGGSASYINGRQLSYSATGYDDAGNLAGPADGAVGQVSTYTSTSFTNRFLTTPLSGTVWVSALVNRYEAQTVAIGFNPDAKTTHRTYVGLGSSNQAVMNYAWTQSTASVTANLGSTYLVLAKIEVNYSGDLDRVSYWFNPSLAGGEGGLGTPTIVQGSQDAVGDELLGVGLLVQRSSTASDTSLIDAVRVAGGAGAFTAVTQGSGDLAADYFNDLWGPVLTEPALLDNTVSGYETTYGGNVPRPGGTLDLPNRVLSASVASGGSTQIPLPLWNVGVESMNWTASSDSAWLTLSAYGGSVAANSAGAITLTANASGLTDGTHTAVVTFTVNGVTQKAQVVLVAGTVPTVTLSVSDPSASEAGPDGGAFTVTRTGSTAEALTVNYTVSGSAENGTDYTTLAGSVTIPIGSASATIPVSPANDTRVENDETVILTLTDAAYAIETPFGQAVTIADNDVATVTVSAYDASASESGDTGTFRILLDQAAERDLTVNYSLGGSALNGATYDYLPILPGSILIPAGATYADITFTPVDDGTVEGSESAVLSVTSGSGYTVGSPANATVTIADNDTGGLLVHLKMNENGGLVAADSSGNGFDAALVNGVSWTTDTPNGGSSAIEFGTASNDYITLGALTELNVSNNLTLSMWVKSSPQTSFPRIYGHVGDVGLEAQSNQDQSTLSLSVHTDAGSGGRSISAQTGAWNHIVWTIGDGAIKTYLNGVYQGSSSYAQGNGFGNNSEWIIGARIANQGGWTGLMDNFRMYNKVLTGTEVTALYDLEKLPTVTIVATDVDGSETGPDAAAFSVQREGPTTSALTVYYAIGGSATNGTDYNILTGSVVIPAGQSSVPITVTPIDDGAAEGDETVTLTLAGNSAYVIETPSAATVRILDNDVPVLTLSVGDPLAKEQGSDDAVFTVTRAGDTGSALTVYYTLGGSATNGVDYQSLSGTLVIPVGASSADVHVVPVDDGIGEGDETVALTLSTNPQYTVLPPGSGSITIVDNILVAWLAMDAGSGASAADSSGHGNNATLVNGVSWTTDTPNGTGYALSFDGSNDYAFIPTSATMQSVDEEMTLYFWVKAPVQTSFPRLFNTRVGVSDGIQMQAHANANADLMIYTSAGQSGTGINNLFNGNWTQLAITMDHGALKTYLNGELVGSTTYWAGHSCPR